MRWHIDIEVSVLFLRITLPWLPWVFPAVPGLSPIAASGGCSRIAVRGRVIAVASPMVALGLQACEPQ